MSSAEGGVSVLFLNTEPQGAEDTYHIHAVEGWPHPVSLTAPGPQPTRGMGGSREGSIAACSKGSYVVMKACR